ncbi:hypothetical protein BVG19_g1590 [[Candida] boidinii]|nr:hypothetical protein BVG19_g1590 [[Candida] boidinii]OWB50337.1 hypothetical protein B5S27_g1886 [[Candida] boidinii]
MSNIKNLLDSIKSDQSFGNFEDKIVSVKNSTQVSSLLSNANVVTKNPVVSWSFTSDSVQVQPIYKFDLQSPSKFSHNSSNKRSKIV